VECSESCSDSEFTRSSSVIKVRSIFSATSLKAMFFSVFTLVGPRVLRSGERYKCSLVTHDLKSSVELNITLSGFTEINAKFLRISHVVKVPRDDSRSVEFAVCIRDLGQVLC
jgi:hypothetical protein